MSSFRRTAALFPPLFALHVLEEAPGFTAWARRHGSPRYSQRDFVRNNALGLAMTAVATRLVARSSTRGLVFGYFSLVLTQQALFNTVFHVGTTIAYREYSPGLVTAVRGFLPLWWQLTRLALDEHLITRSGALGAAAIGGAVHGAAVIQQVYRR
jgi:Protein of unknown function with HXXEE motif